MKDKTFKRIVLIRHGESEWNLIFNVGSKVFMPFKAVIALFREITLFVHLDMGSVLYDSPLNQQGSSSLPKSPRLENFGRIWVCGDALKSVATRNEAPLSIDRSPPRETPGVSSSSAARVLKKTISSETHRCV